MIRREEVSREGESKETAQRECVCVGARTVADGGRKRYRLSVGSDVEISFRFVSDGEVRHPDAPRRSEATGTKGRDRMRGV